MFDADVGVDPPPEVLVCVPPPPLTDVGVELPPEAEACVVAGTVVVVGTISASVELVNGLIVAVATVEVYERKGMS